MYSLVSGLVFLGGGRRSPENCSTSSLFIERIVETVFMSARGQQNAKPGKELNIDFTCELTFDRNLRILFNGGRFLNHKTCFRELVSYMGHTYLISLFMKSLKDDSSYNVIFKDLRRI